MDLQSLYRGVISGRGVSTGARMALLPSPFFNHLQKDQEGKEHGIEKWVQEKGGRNVVCIPSCGSFEALAQGLLRLGQQSDIHTHAKHWASFLVHQVDTKGWSHCLVIPGGSGITHKSAFQDWGGGGKGT